jgi:hypothetical protein
MAAGVSDSSLPLSVLFGMVALTGHPTSQA